MTEIKEHTITIEGDIHLIRSILQDAFAKGYIKSFTIKQIPL